MEGTNEGSKGRAADVDAPMPDRIKERETTTAETTSNPAVTATAIIIADTPTRAAGAPIALAVTETELAAF
jgi:hypothetical protein